MDHFFEECKRTEDIMEFIEDGVLTTGNISKAWILTHVDSNLKCWIHGQKWIKEYIENILGKPIEYYSRYVLNRNHVVSILKAYDLFVSRLAPIYNPESKECVGVSEETVKYLEEELGVDLSDVDFGDLYSSIVDSYDYMKDILFDTVHTDFTILYVAQE